MARDIAPKTSSDSGSVIHDIGFRHYDGPRFGHAAIVRSLLVETLRGVFAFGRPAKSKAMPWTLIGILSVIALIMVVVMIAVPGTGLEFEYNQYLIQFQFFIGLLVASRAPYAVCRDLRDGVMPLYLSRPLTSRDYVAAKFGGLSIGIFIVMAAPLTILLIGSLLAELPPGEHLVMWLKGMAVAALLSVLLSAIGLAIASLTHRRGIGVAGIIAALLLTNALPGALIPVTEQQGNEALGKYLVAFNPFELVDAMGVILLGVSPGSEYDAPSTFAGGAIIVGIFVVLTLGSIAFLLRRYRKIGAS